MKSNLVQLSDDCHTAVKSVVTNNEEALARKCEELQRQVAERDTRIESLLEENLTLQKLVREQKVQIRQFELGA